jgi:hypothetical protein
MYLRKVTRKNKNDKKVHYYQLAHNKRDPKTKKPVAHIIHNFGRADQVDRNSLIRLCKSIARVCGLKVLDISEQWKQEKNEQKDDETKKLFDNVKFIKALEFGTVEVIKFLWEKLGIGEALRSIGEGKGCPGSYEQALLAMTSNRLCEPESKLGV